MSHLDQMSKKKNKNKKNKKKNIFFSLLRTTRLANALAVKNWRLNTLHTLDRYLYRIACAYLLICYTILTILINFGYDRTFGSAERSAERFGRRFGSVFGSVTCRRFGGSAEPFFIEKSTKIS